MSSPSNASNGEMRYCPACKRGTYHTVSASGPWTLYTCRADKADRHTHRVAYN